MKHAKLLAVLALTVGIAAPSAHAGARAARTKKTRSAPKRTTSQRSRRTQRPAAKQKLRSRLDKHGVTRAGTIDRKANPYLASKYAKLGGADRGTYRGRNRAGTRTLRIPRRVDPKIDGTRYASHFPKHFASSGEFAKSHPEGMSEKAFLRMLEKSTPKKVLARIDRTIARAIAEGAAGRARKFPMKDRAKIRSALIYSYLHSRDISVIHSALGYPLKATGVHDLREFVPAEMIKALAKKPGAAPWLVKYAATLKPGTQVNISFYNPNIVADIWLWRPTGSSIAQDAMNVHRLSDHHNGHDGKWDPVETAVNNVHHQRENMFGVRKEPSLKWMDLGHKIAKAEGAQTMAASGVGRGVVKDAAMLMRQLEREGKITPWYLVDGSLK